MSADLRVLQANPSRPLQYCRTSLPITAEGALAGGGTVPVLLHRVIAYTFLGKPSNSNDTVDHVDRDRSNNRADNLRWVSPVDQLNNRVRRTVSLRNPSDHTLHSIAKVAETHPHVEEWARTTRHGDTVDVGAQSMQVVVEERKLVALQHAPDRLGRPRGTRILKKHEALQHFVSGHTVDAVSQTMRIARSTALSYLGQAAREAPLEVLHRLRTRLQLEPDGTFRELTEKLELLNWQVAQHLLTPAQFLQKYQQIVNKYAPCLGGDWEVVKQVWRCLVNA